MKSFIVLACVILVATCTTTGFESIFAQAPKANLGESIQTLIQMHNSQGRLQEISDLLFEIQALLDQQQKTADEQIEKTRLECEGNLATYNQQLTNSRASLASSEEEKEALLQEQSNKSQQLEGERLNNESISNDLQQSQDDLVEEQSTFETFKASFEEAILACEEAVRLLTTLARGNVAAFAQKSRSSGLMFVQLSQSFSDVRDLLEKHVAQNSSSAFVQPIIDILSELGVSSAQVDASKVTQIVELIQTLLTRLREGLAQRKAQNQTIVADLEKLVGSYQSSFNQSSTLIGVLEVRLSEISPRLEELDVLISNTQDVIVAKEGLISNTENDCQSAETVYLNETNSRTSNLALLEQLIQHFTNEVSPTSQQVLDEE